DKLVTGVQTCALPIFAWLRAEHAALMVSWSTLEAVMKRSILAAALSGMILSSAPIGQPVQFETKPRAVATGTFPQIAVRVTGDRSEERRVGKEGRRQ